MINESSRIEKLTQQWRRQADQTGGLNAKIAKAIFAVSYAIEGNESEQRVKGLVAELEEAAKCVYGSFWREHMNISDVHRPRIVDEQWKLVDWIIADALVLA